MVLELSLSPSCPERIALKNKTKQIIKIFYRHFPEKRPALFLYAHKNHLFPLLLSQFE